MIDLDKLKQLYKFSKHLSFSDANELVSVAKTKRFDKKEIILKEGSNRNEILFVRKGLIRQYFINDKGEEITFRLIPENYVVANSDMILFDQPSRYYFEAFEKTKVFSLDYNVVEKIVSNNPKLMVNRIKFAHQMMREMHFTLELFIMHSPEERYLMFIQKYPDISNRVPDKYVANVLGITPVSLSRIRSRIAKK